MVQGDIRDHQAGPQVQAGHHTVQLLPPPPGGKGPGDGADQYPRSPRGRGLFAFVVSPRVWTGPSTCCGTAGPGSRSRERSSLVRVPIFDLPSQKTTVTYFYDISRQDGTLRRGDLRVPSDTSSTARPWSCWTGAASRYWRSTAITRRSYKATSELMMFVARKKG